MCFTKKCRKTPAPKHNYCYACINKRFREKNPERNAFNVQRNNAKRRGHKFTVSFEYWLKFIQKTNYMAGRGITKTSLHVDKIIDSKGYVPGNLQVLTNTANVRKYLGYDYDENGKPYNFKIKSSDNGKTDSDPF